MKCEILWNKLALKDWQDRFREIPRSNILQSYDYALAAAKTNRQTARWGLILINGQEAGLVQIMEAKILWGGFHALMLDRGPLWFDDFGGAAHIQAFFKEINRQFPKRFGRKRRVLPEIEDGLAAQGILKQCGLSKKEDQTGYQSLWWDLKISEEEAYQALKSNWRGSLEKAKKAALTGALKIEWDTGLKFYLWLKTQYAIDKAIRGYNGISPQLLDNLAAIAPRGTIMVGKVSYAGEDIAGVLFLKHGQSATYQIGWSSDKGRQFCAHHLLLWGARDELIKQGIQDLDLGGINDDPSAEGLTKFKTRTGAVPYKLVGQYD